MHAYMYVCIYVCTYVCVYIYIVKEIVRYPTGLRFDMYISINTGTYISSIDV